MLFEVRRAVTLSGRSCNQRESQIKFRRRTNRVEGADYLVGSKVLAEVGNRGGRDQRKIGRASCRERV